MVITALVIICGCWILPAVSAETMFKTPRFSEDKLVDVITKAIKDATRNKLIDIQEEKIYDQEKQDEETEEVEKRAGTMTKSLRISEDTALNKLIDVPKEMIDSNEKMDEGTQDVERRDLALNKSTQQSGNFYSNKHFSGNAVDGKLNTISYTGYERNPWWTVDLTKEVKINFIRCYLNKWELVRGYYENFKVETRMGDNDTWQTCKQPDLSKIPGKTGLFQVIQCNDSRTARHVKISTYYSSKNRYLALFEVQVIGPYVNKTASSVSLTCHELRMSATFDEAILPGNILNISIVGCDAKSYLVRGNAVSTNFKDCVGNVTDSGETITQENMVAVTNGVPDPLSKYNITHRIVVYNYKLQCKFNRRLKVSTAIAVKVVNKEESHGQTRTTNFAASMSLYNSESFMVKATAPFEVVAFQPIYMQILGVHNNTMFKFITEYSYATPTSDPNDKSRYPFLEEKCPVDSTFRVYNTHAENQYRFSVGAFTFIKLKKTVYFHCDLLVCRAKADSEDCTQKCNGMRRKRRAVADDGAIDRFRVTSDAISWKKKPAFDVQVQDVEKGMKLTVFIPNV